MVYHIPSSKTTFNKAMSPEQFNQIIEAILAGKYSWACVLILRFAGYNPLHYIPYRTYNRLMKQNCQIDQSGKSKADKVKMAHKTISIHADNHSSGQQRSKIADLDYLEQASRKEVQAQGGILTQWFPGKSNLLNGFNGEKQQETIKDFLALN